MLQNIREIVGKNTDVDARIQKILIENLGLESKDAEPGYKAYGYMAVEVATALANMFLALKHPDQGRSYKAFCDLTYQLAGNDFWKNNANVILPVVHTALNAYRDGVTLSVDRATKGEYGTNDTLIAASLAAPLELFPLIAYLVGGPGLMVTASIPLKSELAPYFL
ncbi:MAG: hypothetical protein V4649_19555 [Bacteroidota bacterium]